MRPGRIAAIVRITLCCTTVVAIWMVFRIPVPAYAAYLVFLVTGPEVATTLLTAIGGMLAATLAITLSLAFYMLDAGEPALRLPLMALATFLGMFLSRVIAIGPIAFLIGFVLVITQTLIDDIPSLDGLTHFVLWLWVVVAVPALLALVVDLAFGWSPTRLARDRALHVLDAVESALSSGDGSALFGSTTVTDGLVELRKRAEIVDRSIKARHQVDMRLIRALDELVRVASPLPGRVSGAARLALMAACASCRDALRNSRKPSLQVTALSEDAIRDLDGRERPIVLAVASILDRLLAGLVERLGSSDKDVAKDEKAFLLADAFSNPEHVRFALKATIAVMLVYTFYSAVDWSGIRTCVVTCFFVALGSVGETIHKLTLRLSGALAGGALGVVCIVFVLPHVTDIGGLLLVIAAVSALGAWIATSSERLAYAGMQMAFAFFIGVLQGYGPTEELTVLRDRVLGILLGNIAMSVVFMTIWPVSAVAQANAKLREALAVLARLVRGPADDGRRAATAAIEQARRLLAISIFESAWADREERSRTLERVGDIDRLTAATLVLLDQPRFAEIDATWREAVATWLERPSAATLPADTPIEARLTALAGSTPTAVRAAFESQLVLSLEMRRVAANA